MAPTRQVWFLLSVAAVALVVVTWRSGEPLVQRALTRWLPPSVDQGAARGLTATEQATLRLLGRVASGRVVWSSNRSGNHEIYSAELGSAKLQRLTTHPHVDYLARYSPDGRSLAFLRSRRPWVSFRELDGWDLFVMDATGAGVRRVSERAYHPAWNADGTAITFLRDNRIWQVAVESGREVEIHDGRQEPTRGTIGDPEPGPAGLIGLSLRGVSRRRQGIWVLERSSARLLRVAEDSSACQVSWTADGGLVWVEAAGRGGTRVMQVPRLGDDPSVLIDLPGRHSHEYFPRVSADGRWLIWGASTGGHEHDRADYEIFIWRIGTPWNTATRVTDSPANDQWPDLRLQ